MIWFCTENRIVNLKYDIIHLGSINLNLHDHDQASANTIRGLGTGHIPETAFASNVLKEVGVNNIANINISIIFNINTIIASSTVINMYIAIII